MTALDLAVIAVCVILLGAIFYSKIIEGKPAPEVDNKYIGGDEFPGESAGAFLQRMRIEESRQDAIRDAIWEKENPSEAKALKRIQDGSHWDHPTPKLKSGRIEIVGENVDPSCIGLRGTITNSVWAPGGGTGYKYHVDLDNGEYGLINHADIVEI